MNVFPGVPCFCRAADLASIDECMQILRLNLGHDTVLLPGLVFPAYLRSFQGVKILELWSIEFKDFNFGYCQCTFLCTTLKRSETFQKIWDSVHKI